MKTCKKCLQEKPLTDFFKAVECRDGREGSCKSCRSRAAATRYCENKEEYLARIAKYRSYRASGYRHVPDERIPHWANKKKIARIYDLSRWASKFTDEPLHVDHIIPLRGKNISGLHVESNLQILPKSANIAKGNSF